MNSSQTLDLVRVAVPVPLRRHFDYLSPLPLPAPGCRVEIPFGPQTLVGLVVDHPAESQVPRNKLKPIKRVLDSAPVLGPDILALMAWSAGYYQHPLGEVLPHALPVLSGASSRGTCLTGVGRVVSSEAAPRPLPDLPPHSAHVRGACRATSGRSR